MVNKRMKAPEALRRARRAARQNGYTVEHLPGRGKGSHAIYAVLDSDGNEVGRFSLTGPSDRDLSWTVLRNLENGLAKFFGAKWMEK